MSKTTKIGIWMDHARAHLIEFTADPMRTSVVESAFTHGEKKSSMEHGENRMHNKEKHGQAEYYGMLIAEIKKHQDVLLFGPTDAKVELFNLVKKDHNAARIRIVVRDADKMTENQQHAFVKNYFTHEPPLPKE